MFRLCHERDPLLRKPLSRQPACRHHPLWWIRTPLDSCCVDRPILATPIVLCAATPRGTNRRRLIRAVRRFARPGLDEAIPTSGPCCPLNHNGIQPLHNQVLGVHDAAMRHLVLDDEGPRCTLIEVLLKVSIGSLVARYRIRTAGKNQLWYRNCSGRKAYRVHAKWVEMSG